MPELDFRLTYATMFDPPEQLHQLFDAALEEIKPTLGQEHPMTIGGSQVRCAEKFEDRSPTDLDLVLGVFQQGGPDEAAQAVEAARKAWPGWRRTPWPDRVAMLRKAAALIRERCFVMAAGVALSVGKNRMESLGDVVETADLIDYACDQMEANDGFVTELARDPLTGMTPRNQSLLRPHGPWLVVSPFNFPGALTGGPSGAALVTGNTVVLKCSSDTPLGPRLLSDCFLEAGLPEGVFNFVTGPGGAMGQALIENPDLAGVTFTGSYQVGMAIHRLWAQGQHVRPVILEMGGKNPTIVTANADVDMAALGVMRSAFGLQGQKCSACSRVYVEKPVYDQFVAKLLEVTGQIAIGDPTRREVYMGPVISRAAQAKYQGFCSELAQAGEILCGGKVLDEGELAGGWFCAPTVAAGVPLDHRLWKEEMFLPITMVAPFEGMDQAMELANDSPYGLTAGIYGSAHEVERFFDDMVAGICYANRPTGATTGAWPGLQPFGGCKASGAAGKNAGGPHYLQLYLHEQIRAQIVSQG